VFSELDLRALLGRDALTQWRPPRPGDCTDETKVFKMFVEAMSGVLSARLHGNTGHDLRSSLSDEDWRFKGQASHLSGSLTAA
jgi:hypothetical protein